MGVALVVIGALMVAGAVVAGLVLRSRDQQAPPPQSSPYGVPAFGWGQQPPPQPPPQQRQQWPPTGGSSTPGG